MTTLLSLFKGAEPLAILLPIAIMAIFGYFFFKNTTWDLMDEVIDEGDALLFRKGKLEQRVALEDITNISHPGKSSGARVIVHSRNSGPLGNEMPFQVPTGLNPFAKSPIVTELIERVDRARNT